jgi:hypothetical protein
MDEEGRLLKKWKNFMVEGWLIPLALYAYINNNSKGI